MTRRSRPPNEIRMIVRALRRRFISGEVERTAQAALSKIAQTHPDVARSLDINQKQAKPTAHTPHQAKPDDLLESIRQREGINTNTPEPGFTAQEQAQARALLDRLQAVRTAGGSDEHYAAVLRGILTKPRRTP